ncbi:homeobox-leucine zipper protein ROC5-like isoform X1 [Zingiber officinale]|uniref:homeobox-leucine zipper protein ROC5-like isoform X1 n=1 Tax=Zingiber officinale TaxID=94328 RepID=UPI001C4B3EA3|nr:homeobox-leucine zipper protein ROC5-like isoform X1 [Zingiber officinale]XP_042453412.1 homeobox-leucine zipper protein ROC5-like isoform X1 [Zingiber officinale]XP_042453413.1 homeobox-leucine zipper protein ROC5-like isoform X1 [Zingiber officinale]
MSFRRSASMNAGGDLSPRGLVSHRSQKKHSFTSPALSLGLQTGTEAQMNLSRITGDENDCRSGSDNLETVSGDDVDQEQNPRKKKKRYHRHTPQQIQELEALFKDCPHPDEKQRLELSKRLCLESRQVKFWFQNRRTQMKTQIERHENAILRQENDKLRADNMAIGEATRNPVCSNCGGAAMLGDISLEEQNLRIENARLKEELDRLCALAGKFLGRSTPCFAADNIDVAPPPFPRSLLELGVGSNGGFAAGLVPPELFPPTPATISPLHGGAAVAHLTSSDRSMLLELALAAMDELLTMAHMDAPLWIRSSDGSAEALNYEQYHHSVRRIAGLSPAGFVAEASRQTGMVIVNSLALVETFMDSDRWANMFSSIVAKNTTVEVICNGAGGTKNGALQLMRAELQVLSPLVAIREVNFLRFCKQQAEGTWVVVDVSVDFIRENASSGSSCRLMPSGFVVRDMPNDYSKLVWVEHAEYDESQVHLLYRPLLRSGLAFGAGRWLATLQRRCECLAILSSASNLDESGTITASGRRSMLKLAQRMTEAFCSGVCKSSAHEWTKLESHSIGPDVHVMTRKSVGDPGEPAGVVLSTATSVPLPLISPKRLFDFLREAGLRSKWDILSNGGPMYEMAHIAKGQAAGNAVSLLRASVRIPLINQITRKQQLNPKSQIQFCNTQAVSSNQPSMLILQETCADASGAMVVYAPVDVPAMHLVMNGGDSAYVALLPSGFAILPDGGEGSLLTVGFQILVNNQPTAKLTVESVETVNSLISCTVQKIKAAVFHYGD